MPEFLRPERGEILKAYAARILRGSSRLRLFSIVPLLFCLLPVALGISDPNATLSGLPWGILLTCSALMLLGFVTAMMREGDAPPYRLAGMSLMAGAMIAVVAELVFLMDRMNTIFKFYNAIWLLLGLSAATFVELFVRRVEGFAGASRRISSIAVGVLLICLSLPGAAGGLLDIGIMWSFHRVPGPRPTLDGRAYLEENAPAEAALIKWINSNVSGDPVLLEAHGPSYGPFTRMAMHTGLPTVLGWDYHVMQRGTPPGEIQKRSRDIEVAYRSPRVDEVLRVLERYNVRYVMFGDLERRTYGAAAEKKFDENPAFFERVFSSESEHLYKVRAPYCG